MSVNEVRKRIHRVVSIGDSREEVAKALARAKVRFSYDKYEHQFYSAIREGCSGGTAVMVYLAFDDLDKLTKIEVSKSNTFW